MQISNTPSKRLFVGLRQISAGKYKQVHTQAIDWIKTNVRDPAPYCLLGHIAAEHGNHKKAIELFETASEYAPDSPFYMAHHAKALSIIGRQQDSKNVIDKAARLPISDAHTADIIGVVYSRTGFHEKAIPFFRKAVEMDDRPANFYYNLGSSLQFSGEFEAAEKAYKSALVRNPALFRARSSLVSLRKQTQGENVLDQLKADFKSYSKSSDAALHLGHAIAKTLEDLEQHPESLEWLIKAKAGKYAELDPNIEKLFTAAKATLNSDADIGDKSSASPIFIVGLPRTGTTLVDRIISSHPSVVSAGELNTFAEQIKYLSETTSSFVMEPRTFIATAQKSITKVGKTYIDKTGELARGAKRFTDKMPLNFFYCALILRALPNARIVALRRGAMDSCLSNYRQLFATQFSYYNYTLNLTDTAQYYRAFDDLMAFWRNRLPANRFMEVLYEDIVLDQKNQTRRLLNFCDLEWDEACMRFHENKAPVSTASSVQVRQPLYSGSIGRWKKYGDKLDDLKAALGDLAD